MKTTTKVALTAMGVMVGVTGLAASGNAEDWRHGGREPAKVVVVHKQVVRQPAYVRGGLFDRLDINNSGSVAKWEFNQRYGDGRVAKRTFNRLDRNNNGTLSQQEVAWGRDMLRELKVRG